MKKTDLDKFNIRSKYELFNILLFNNSLPRANNIDFILHNLTYAAGYSKRRTRPSKKTGNVHEIAFCKYFIFTERQITEILIHEMIHLWQVDHVAEWRYTKCTNAIAHDKVFTSKMNTINLILKRKGYDYTISEVCTYKLELDPLVSPKKDYWIFYCESAEHTWFKVKDSNYSKIVREFSEEFDGKTKHPYFTNVYARKERSYLHNLLEFCEDIPNEMIINEDYNFQSDKNPNNFWIVKDGKYINESEK